MKNTQKNLLVRLIILLAIPLTIALGIILFQDRNYGLISIIIAFLSLIPLFIKFERANFDVKEMTALAVMIALSVAGRSLFAILPGFKPVTAIVIICGIYFGKEAGFLTGSLSALISNMFFGQGPWTPFQMLVWGLIGYIAGLFGEKIVNWWGLIIAGIFSGIMFSLIMDIWFVLSADGTFNLSRYLGALVSSFYFTIIYIVSNIIFLLVLTKPIGKKLNRLKTKYGLFNEEKNPY